MKKQKLVSKLVKMCIKAVEEENYNLIREASVIAYENGIEMSFDDEYVTVEDETVLFNGAF